MPAFLTTLTAKLIGAAVIAILSFGGGLYLEYRLDQETITEMKLSEAQRQVVDVTAALDKFRSLADTVHTSSLDYNQTSDRLGAKLDELQKEFHDAIKPAPLPPDCRPDSARMRSLSEALAAANAATTTETVRRSGETVRTNSSTNNGGL